MTQMIVNKASGRVANAVIVHGPQGCGKTRHAVALAAHFGLGNIWDEWLPGDQIEADTLHLSQQEVAGSVNYDSLKVELRLV